MGLSQTVRAYVRRHDLRPAKAVYRKFAVPCYRWMGIPLYDITASAQYGYTWFRIPKNATHSIMQLLQEHAPPDVNSSYVPYFYREHKTRFRFCVLRNPWDRLVSVYCNKVQMKLMYPDCWNRDFEYFIDFVSKLNLHSCDGHLRLQTAMFPAQDIDFIARIERLDDDIREIAGRIGIPQNRLGRLGSIPHQDYRTFYTPGLRDRVETLYAADIAYGGYTYGNENIL